MAARGRFSLEAKLGALAEGRRANAERRLAPLRERLASFDPPIEVRDDSKLAWGYATQTGDARTMDMQTVADEMATTQFLYAQTCYNALMQDDMKRVAEYHKAANPDVGWTKLWKVVTEHFVPVCKIEAVERAGGLSY